MAKRILSSGGSRAEMAAFVAIVSLLAHNVTEVFFYSPVLMSMVMLIVALPTAVSLNESTSPCDA